MSTASEAANLLRSIADTLEERDAEYKGSDEMYAHTIKALFPNGITLTTDYDHHRFHILMLIIVKLTRYCTNFAEAHADRLVDGAAYMGMLSVLDARKKA